MTELDVLKRMKTRRNKLIREISNFRNILAVAVDVIPKSEKDFLREKIFSLSALLSQLDGEIDILEKQKEG